MENTADIPEEQKQVGHSSKEKSETPRNPSTPPPDKVDITAVKVQKEQEDSQALETVRQELSSHEDEQGEERTTLEEYIRTRCKDEAIIKASRYARQNGETGEVYQEKLSTATSEIIDLLGIDRKLFSDQRNAEVFLSIADSWLMNEHNQQDPRYAVERQFLTEVTRILAGENSTFNQQERDKGSHNAEKYIEVPGSHDYQEAVEELDRYRQHTDEEKTNALQALFSETGDGSLLQSVRGAYALDEEKPYKVMVLNVKDSFKYTEGQDDPPEWSELTQTEAAAFVMVDPKDNIRCIVIPSHMYDEFQSDDSFTQKNARSTTAHEWAHTQKSMKLGYHGLLGRIWDENMVITASKSHGHADAVHILGTMNILLRKTEGIELRDQFTEAISREEADPQFYQFISNHFGLRTLLLTMAVQPKSYTEEYGIKQIPNIRMDAKERLGDLQDLILQEREEIHPGSRDAYLEYHREMPQETLELMPMIEGYSGVRMPEDVKQVIQDRLQKAKKKHKIE